MASENTIQRLYETALNSSSFKGMLKEDVWKACLTYKERSDKEIEVTIQNILKKNHEEYMKSEEDRTSMVHGREKISELHKKEEVERTKDSKDAEKILEELFNM